MPGLWVEKSAACGAMTSSIICRLPSHDRIATERMRRSHNSFCGRVSLTPGPWFALGGLQIASLIGIR